MAAAAVAFKVCGIYGVAVCNNIIKRKRTKRVTVTAARKTRLGGTERFWISSGRRKYINL